MYTWGYVKNASLAKLDLTENEANENNLINRFYVYANEAITQICSAIKPLHTFKEFKVAYKNELWFELRNKYNVYREHLLPIVKPSTLNEAEKNFWNEFESYNFVGEVAKMPTDFVSFGDDVNTRVFVDDFEQVKIVECHDDDFVYEGYNKLRFLNEGSYRISYNARWYTFSSTVSDDILLDVPADILDCIPSYIAHQCYKVDDPVKAAEFRNEYEMFLARIDDTDYKQTKTFTIGGDW